MPPLTDHGRNQGSLPSVAADRALRSVRVPASARPPHGSRGGREPGRGVRGRGDEELAAVRPVEGGCGCPRVEMAVTASPLVGVGHVGDRRDGVVEQVSAGWRPSVSRYVHREPAVGGRVTSGASGVDPD